MKLRLLITPKCNRSCEMCCNKSFDLMTLPQIGQADEFSKYTEISLTGGEPMLEYDKLRETIMYIREYGDFKGEINLYTAMPGNQKLIPLANRVNLIITIHDKEALIGVIDLYQHADIDGKNIHRIKLAPTVHQYFYLLANLCEDWQLEKFDWIVDCPLPEGEEFKRI